MRFLKTINMAIFSQGKELNMVFGFQLSVARVGSTVNFLLMGWVLVHLQSLQPPLIYRPLFEWISENLTDGEHNPTAVGWTLLIAGTSCLMSFLCRSHPITISNTTPVILARTNQINCDRC